MPGILTNEEVNLDRPLFDMQQTYEDSAADSSYIMDDGKMVIPVQGPEGTPPVILGVYAAFTMRKSRFSYTKRRVPPLIPSPHDTRSGSTFLTGTIQMISPGVSAAGETIFQVAGEYTFVCASHVKETGLLLWDAHPYISGVDMLGNIPQQYAERSTEKDGFYYNTYTGIYFDLSKFSTSRILG